MSKNGDGDHREDTQVNLSCSMNTGLCLNGEEQEQRRAEVGGGTEMKERFLLYASKGKSLMPQWFPVAFLGSCAVCRVTYLFENSILI